MESKLNCSMVFLGQLPNLSGNRLTIILDIYMISIEIISPLV